MAVNGKRVYVFNKTRETFVATEAALADTYWGRLVGLLGKTRRWARPGRGLWIYPSHGVHTIGMLFPIDLVFLDGFCGYKRLSGFVKNVDAFPVVRHANTSRLAE